MTVDELLTSKNVDHRQQGRDFLVRCFNPEHEDRNPSMRIDTITGIFNCLACGFKGSVFAHFGEEPNFAQIRRDRLKEKILNKMSETIGFNMPSDASPYRGDWRNISAETYERFQAFESIEPQFLGRVVFPIKDASGIIVVFLGRHTTMNHDPKYLFHPRKVKIPLYPLVAPIKGRVILVEGIFDMLNLHDKGLENAICTFGTNTLNAEKLELLKIQGVEGIDFLFDGDEAGRSAAQKAALLAEEMGFLTRNIGLKDGEDPGSLSASTIRKLKEKLYG